MKAARLGDVTESMKNGLYKHASQYGDGGLPCLRMYNIDAGGIVWRDIKRMRVSDEEREDYGLRAGDLLVNRVNSRELVGKTAVIPLNMEPSVFESKNIRLRLKADRARPKFINYQLLAGGRRYFSANAQQVVGMASVSQTQLADFPIVLTDLATQDIIVAELEMQFSRLDEAVANLKRVKANLKRYKAAVLKAAVEGHLVPTEAELARRDGRSYETGAQLLHCILENRRGELRGNQAEPASPDIADLLNVPTGWEWASIDQIAAETLIGLDRGRDKQNDERRGCPYVRMNNVNLDGDVNWDDLVHVDASDSEQQRFGLRDGDLLFNTRNSKELVGKVGLVLSPPARAIYNNNLMRIRIARGVSSAFVCAQMCSIGFRARMEKVKRATTNVAAVYAKNLLPLAIALPSTDEQFRIVSELDRRMSLVREIEVEVDTNLKRTHALRNTTLTRYFSSRSKE